MKGYSVYMSIKQMKERGFSRNAVAKHLGINRRTVDRYWNMPTDEYEALSINRKRPLDKHREVILLWLEEYPSLSAAQICDWLKEHYEAGYPERTVSRYVRELRERYGIIKVTSEPRMYEAVEELPPGKQMQVDFGEKWMQAAGGGRIKEHFATFVLSHSRYKYVEFQSRPFTSVDLSGACRRCFEYIGGIPQELVFDQDSIVAVNENHGNIIYTYEFEKLRQDMKFNVYLCRGNDPESKGKIENVVKFVKQNFLENRVYAGDDILNSCGLEWLVRTGNGKVHSTTKRVPAEVFKEEREFLRALPPSIITDTECICRTVRKDNTILYDSNRYSVPLGTYNAHKEVQIQAKDGILSIMSLFGDQICEHMISPGRGMLVKNNNHGRNRDEKLDKLLKITDALFEHEAYSFLYRLRCDLSRYARDQLTLIEKLCSKYGRDRTLKAIRECEKLELFNATYVKDYIEHSYEPPLAKAPVGIAISDSKYHAAAAKRSIEEYVKAGDSK